MSKQRLLFITTGGTIASVRTAQGLKPVLTSEELLAHLPELQQLCCPETLNLCSIDSTDLGPEHWLMMAKAVQENYALYDGFIICHGTDTLAYSAAALSYLVQNADKPIILTGAQQPISNEITDAKKNLRDSVICALDPGSRGVMVVFGGHVIAGTRAKKNKTISYDAFASVNFPALALVQGDRLVRYVPSPWPTGPVEFGRALNPKVFLLKLTPGLSPDIPGSFLPLRPGHQRAPPALDRNLSRPSFNNMTASLWKALAWAAFPSGSWMHLLRSWAITTRTTRS